jgi:hypothetical protein
MKAYGGVDVEIHVPLASALVSGYLNHLHNYLYGAEPFLRRVHNNFPAFYGSRSFIAVFKTALSWFLSWVRPIQFIPPHPI